MFKYYFLILLIINLFDISLTLSCIANSCDNVRCNKVADCGPGQIRGKGGFCLCCDVCRKIIGEGEDCSSGSPIAGVTSDRVTCDQSKDLICMRGVCRKVDQ